MAAEQTELATTKEVAAALEAALDAAKIAVATAHADLAMTRDAAARELAAFTASRATELATANELAAELAAAKEATAAAESALAAEQAELATTKEAAAGGGWCSQDCRDDRACRPGNGK